MIAELGHFCLIIALLIAVVAGTLPLAGASGGRQRLMALARPAAQAQFLFTTLAFAALTFAFVGNDFSVRYVAQHSNSALPVVYRVTAVWGGHEGSMLLWAEILTLWMLAVSAFSRHLPDAIVARVLAVMSLTNIGFLAFILAVSNPFERLLPAAADGRDLNPLLQDPGMVIHPPMLYMGYVGFSVAFAFAIAALMSGRLDAAWARWSRPWTTIAWAFLTLGIAIGSWWAYYELGWGGWWFWDPVENASFMPWLVGTALVHSLAATEKRGAFRAWTVLLAICAFSLSLLGTFLVRSGVLTSVHAFATDPKRGLFILVLLVVVIGGSLVLFASRAPAIRSQGAFALLSRESMLLANNVLLIVAAGCVLLGTVYPLVLDALGGGKISVGPPYFEAVFTPLMVPVVLLMAIGPLIRWKEASVVELVRPAVWPMLAALVAAAAIPTLFGRWSALSALGMFVATWVLAATVSALAERVRIAAAGPRGAIGGMARQPRAFWGMLLAHAGIGVFVVGVTLVKTFEAGRDVRMSPGDTASLAGHVFRLDNLADVRGPNYIAVRATVLVTREGRPVATLFPEKRIYNVQKMPMTEAAIDSGAARDLYVSLGERLAERSWSVRIQYKPFVNWIWGGCLFMAVGGLLAASDRRYRLRAVAADAASRSPAASAGA